MMCSTKKMSAYMGVGRKFSRGANKLKLHYQYIIPEGAKP